MLRSFLNRLAKAIRTLGRSLTGLRKTPASGWAGWMLLLMFAASRSSDTGATSGARDGVGRSIELFRTSDNCMACHNGLTLSTGEDVSIGSTWRATMMANSSRDPYWQASVRRETVDHPKAAAEIEDECAVCHMPMARTQAVANGRKGQVFAHLPIADADSDDGRLAADGVSCTLCHQITPAKLGTRESFTGGYAIDHTPALDGRPPRLGSPPQGRPPRLASLAQGRPVYGPFAIDKGHTRIMHSSSEFVPTESAHIRQSEMCATCHTLYTNARGPAGTVIGELPEQVPFLEWRHSAYRGERSCQSCHMPAVNETTRIASVLGEQRDGLARHSFLGGNFFMLRMLNRFRTELGVTALPQELEAAARATEQHLQTDTAVLAIDRTELAGGRLLADVSVRNLTGHKLPTAYPSRRVWIHFAVRDRNGRTVFDSGAVAADGHIVGNDNDQDRTKAEPHYREIRRPDEVQVYESIMRDGAGAVTTGLLQAAGYLKDNRLLPRGFDKATAERDIAVHGSASDDGDFTGDGDRIRYAVDTAAADGPFRVDVELWYQPIGFRWAQNLAPYDTAETRRFVAYYDSMSAASAHVLARASATVR